MKRDDYRENVSRVIIAENAGHEGKPRTMSTARAQESWEEFKERTNRAAEAVLDEVTHPQSLRTKLRQRVRRAQRFYRTYELALLAGASLVIAGACYVAFRRWATKTSD